MDVKRERLTIVAAGLVIGVIAAGLAALGNPVNMGFSSPASCGTSPGPWACTRRRRCSTYGPRSPAWC